MSHHHRHKHKHRHHRHEKKERNTTKVKVSAFSTLAEIAPDYKRKRPKKLPRGRPIPKGSDFGKESRFKPGVSGNPGGRPKFAKISEAAREFLAAKIPGDPHGRTFAEGIVEGLGVRALLGDRSAAAELADRAEGRAVQGIAFTEGGDGIKTLLAEMGKRSKKAGQPEEEE